MKRHFVLDENILVLAAKTENERGEPDPTCLELIRAIEEHCHALVLTGTSWGRYSSHMKDLGWQRTMIVPGIMAILRSLLANAEKDIRHIPNEDLLRIEGLERLPGIDTGDSEFVRAAASVPGAILVTTDGPLTDIVIKRGIAQTYGFTIRKPADALMQAGPDEP